MTPSEDAMSEFLRYLKRLLLATYGERFEYRVNSPQACAAWEGVWRAACEGKTPSRCRKAIESCIRVHSVPFTPAHFEEQYSAIPSEQQPTRHLPPPPISDREVASEYIAMIRSGLNASVTKRTERNIRNGTWTADTEAAHDRDRRVIGWGEHREPYHPPGGDRACAYPGCAAGGTLSAGNKGGGPWYCRNHWRA